MCTVSVDLRPLCYPVTGDVSCYLAFLPPSYHLLLRVHSDDVMGGGVAVLLATDCWHCLGLVSNYLHSIETRTTILT